MTKPKSPKPTAPSIEQFVTERDEVRFTENQEIARKARAATAHARELADEVLTLKRRLGILEKLDAAKIAPPEWLTPKGPSRGHRAIASLFYSDVHWGERVEPGQIDNINCYNVAIAEQRTRRAFEGALVQLRDYIKGVEYDGVQVWLGGDLVSGNIRDLRETNEGTVFEQVLGVSEAVAAGVTLLAKEMPAVHLVGVVGNHTRTTLKPISKNRVTDSFDWLVYQILARQLQNQKGVTFQIGEAADARAMLFSTRYFLTHGDAFRGGTGISAELAPLLLGVHRTTKREADAGHPFDVMLCAHFHRHLFLSALGLIVNGSVIGYNEHAYQSKYSPQPPQCGMWLTTPERGITISAPVFVQDRKAEGW